MTLKWSKRPFLLGGLYAFVICLPCYFTNISLGIPWEPIGVIGIAVAFYLGFKNNSSYDRTWEARKIWGSMVNNSRAFGAGVMAFVKGENQDEIRKELIYRHVAWLTALRYQLRLSRTWEHTEERIKGRYAPIVCEDYITRLDHALENYISKDDLAQIENATNRATQLLRIQSERMQELRDQNYFEDFRHMEFHHHITSLYADQGKAERIKNFPFPRQYASTALWMTMVFSVFVPFGLLDIFGDTSSWLFWLCPFMSGLIMWVFFLMEKIGDYSENPFEGTYNDVPITNIARGIEIDLREMLNDENIPAPIEPENGFLM